MNSSEVLRRFDRQMRREAASGDPQARIERDSRTVLWFDDGWSGVVWSDLDAANADEAIAHALARLRAAGGDCEWKLYAHDRPPDLPQRLCAAGLAPGEEEAVLVADLAALDLEAPPREGVELEVASDAAAVAEFVAVHDSVFGGDHAALGRSLVRALEREPRTALAVVARAKGEPVAAARIEFEHGSDFASLWGGGTLPEWRRLGIYRATVALRGRLARERGYRYLAVDALPTSRPILERLGFVQLTTTTPYTAR